MASPNRHLLLVAYALVAAAVVAADVNPVLSAVFAAPLVLLLPGWALRSALGVETGIDSPARGTVLSVAISMAVVILGGLLLNAVFALTGTSWTLWLVAVTCLASGVAWMRERRAASGRHSVRPRLTVSVWRVVSVGIVVGAALVAAVVLTETSSRNAYNKPVMQLSLAPAPGSAGTRLRLAVTNVSSDRVTVVLTIRRSGKRPAAVHLRLGPSATWTRSERASGGRLTASLAQAGRSAPPSVVAWQPAGTGE
jgi:hypothetical protein